jgi:thiamine biosynthesis lipoprotein
MPGVRFSFEAIGTKWNIELFDAVSEKTAGALKSEILARIETFDKHYSRFRDDSLVSKMSREAGRYTLPDDAQPLMDLYQKLYTISGGSVTPLIGQTLVEAGYDAEYSLQPGELTKPPKWEQAMEYDFPHLLIRSPALLDFGAAGKGYLTDIIGGLLKSWGASAFCIDAGGDILYKTSSDTPLEIALEHPGDTAKAIGIAKIHDQSLCGSAGNRRAWGQYHHIINPRTLASPRHIAAAWVVADTGLLADGLATAVFFMNPKVLALHFDFEYAIVRADYSLAHSPDFPADFFVSKHNEKIR